MIRFIFGRARSGKTASVLNCIKSDVESGEKQVVLLVPEQSSFDYERSLLHILGDGKFTRVPVLSFTRLIDEVGRFCGDLVGKRLDDCGRAVLMSRAMKAVGEKLSVFGKYSSNVGFIGNILDTVDELKRCGIDSESLRTCGNKLPGSTLSKKLQDIALLCDAYDGMLQNGYIDSSDDMLRLDRQLSEYSYFSEKTVYIDAFKNFTGAQLKIIERIISSADEVVFSFCFEPSSNKNVFLNVLETVKEIKKLAVKHSVKIEKDTYLPTSHYSNDALAALELGLFGENVVYDGETEAVTVCTADSIFDEAEFVANEIRRLVRTEGYRYRDFAVISRDDEQYRTALEYMCERYSVPLFKDKRHEITHFALSAFLLSAMRACDGFATEDIMRFLKTELAGLTFDEVTDLENYVYIWKINRGDWKKEWTMNPSGLGKFSDRDRKHLETLNALRTRAIEPLIRFEREFCGSGADMAAAVWKLMERCDIPSRLAALAKDMPDGDLLQGGYDAVIGILDSLHDVLGDENCTVSSFAEYFNLALETARIGAIPQMLDEVTFGAADRIKPRDPRVVFVLGLNQGVFPRTASSGGIIASGERGKLLSLGLPITDRSVAFSVDEEYLLYTSLCCAGDRVYACCSKSDRAGAELQPSVIVSKIKRILPSCRVLSFGKDSFAADRIETADAAFAGFMRTFDDSPLCAALGEIYSSDEKYSHRLNDVRRALSGEDASVSPELGERLFGKNMYLSATGINTYFNCSFAYFCKYGLNAKILKPAEIDVLQRGTIIHAVLEQLITEKGETFSLLTDEEIYSRVDEIVEEYLAAIDGIEQIRDLRFEYIVLRIKKLSREVVCHMRKEFAQSGFVPVKCELKIGGDDADVDYAVIKSDEGAIMLRGSIDRVDRYGAYVRVVDYKTGTKGFYLSDVLYGLNMQMLLYLYALMQSKQYRDCIPAGVLYLEVRNRIQDGCKFSTNGILLEDMDVIDAMDSGNTGEFVPKYKIKKDGTPAKNNDSFIKSETFSYIFDHMEELLRRMNRDLLHGKIPVNPRDGKNVDACKYCDFAPICQNENKAHETCPSMSREQIEEILKEGQADV